MTIRCTPPRFSVLHQFQWDDINDTVLSHQNDKSSLSLRNTIQKPSASTQAYRQFVLLQLLHRITSGGIWQKHSKQTLRKHQSISLRPQTPSTHTDIDKDMKKYQERRVIEEGIENTQRQFLNKNVLGGCLHFWCLLWWLLYWGALVTSAPVIYLLCEVLVSNCVSDGDEALRAVWLLHQSELSCVLIVWSQ